MGRVGTVRPKFYTAPGGFGGAMPSLSLLRKMLATLDRARRENRPYWFALTVPVWLKRRLLALTLRQ